MTYYVFGGTLSLTQSINQSVIWERGQQQTMNDFVDT